MQNHKERFVSKFVVDQNSGCWNWIASLTRVGYGQFFLNGTMQPAHRVAYELFKEPIPHGLDLDHLCRNTKCCNPEHLEPVTHKENILRGQTVTAANSKKTECNKGHPFNEENTRWTPQGKRECRQCLNTRTNAYKKRVRQPT